MIRNAKIEDSELIAQYNRDAAVEAWNKPLDYDKSIKGVQYVIENPNSWFFLVYEKDEIVVSILLITFEWSDWRSGNWYLVQSVYTLPEHRKQWYFKALLNQVKEISVKDPHSCWLKLEVRNDNDRAQTVYKNLWFQDSEHQVFVLEK